MPSDSKIRSKCQSRRTIFRVLKCDIVKEIGSRNIEKKVYPYRYVITIERQNIETCSDADTIILNIHQSVKYKKNATRLLIKFQKSLTENQQIKK